MDKILPNSPPIAFRQYHDDTAMLVNMFSKLSSENETLKEQNNILTWRFNELERRTRSETRSHLKIFIIICIIVMLYYILKYGILGCDINPSETPAAYM